MASFRESELERLTRLAIENWPAQAERRHPHVLAPEIAGENLQEDIRDSALGYFDAHDIAWWVSATERSERKERAIVARLPTGHLNSSQVACVNHLEAARVDLEMALLVARRFDSRVADVRDTGEGGYVAFEWIGKPDYLHEAGAPVRGANVTSLDAVMHVTLDDGTDTLIAIEWKYLESYGADDVGISVRGTDRVATYRALIEAAGSPFVAGDAARLFYEPYYQLMRQTLLASRLVADADTPETAWLHFHVIPMGNSALRLRLPAAAPLLVGQTLEQTWRSALKTPEQYRVVTPSDVVPAEVPAAWRRWRAFLADRYLT